MNTDCKNCQFNTKVASALNESGFSQLSDNHAVVNFQKGDTIIKQGTFSTNVAFLRTGLVKLHITGPYNEQIVRLVKAPSYLGLPTTFGDKINQYSVTAVSEVSVCFIDMTIFRTLLKENEQFSYEIILDLCRNELESFRRCANRIQRQTRGNIAGLLLELADDIFASDEFTLPLSQSEIGNLVDSTRETVSRVLTEFDKDGTISLNGKIIRLLNRTSLELICKNG
ncbi:MAG: Crp/Fnr family transcriptional regulator [Paludibacteraceae bacterium]|nr:Crp/Fnr family transcriptional regulator [Paludibacteraceae bacterium]